MKLGTAALLLTAALCVSGPRPVEASTEEGEGRAIGIDLGTTYSCVGVFEEDRVEILTNEQGNRVTPSYVAFSPDGLRLVGDAAKYQVTTNPENTIFDVKRLIGRSWDDLDRRDLRYYPFKVVDVKGKPFIEAKVKDRTKLFAPEEISAMVLGKMRETAEARLGGKVSRAVVTVPAYFTDAQRQATKDAGTIAGLNVMQVLNEPTAAAIAYGFYKAEGRKNVLVFDLGGGTFDVSLLTIDNGAFNVQSTNGDTRLGGEDFDERVMDYLIKVHKRKTGKDIRSDSRAVQKLRREVEKAKRTLSYQYQTRIEIDSILNDGQDFSEALSRAKFEELNIELFKSTLEPVKKVLEDSGLRKADVDEVVLVGGSTRIPKVQQLVKEFFDGKEPSHGINPDEAVAWGAAVHAGLLSGQENKRSLVLVDVTPRTLGIAVHGGIMAPLVPRNTIYPTKESQIFTTVRDNQPIVTIEVYEGERSMIKDNHLLGNFDLTGIRPAPRGRPKIEVIFEIDANGILQVTAEDKGTGNKNKIVIQNDRNRLKPEEIERMISESEQWAEEDRKVKERVEARNGLEGLVYSLTGRMENTKFWSILSEADRGTFRQAVEEMAMWLEAHSDAEAEEFWSKKKELEQVVQPILDKVFLEGEDSEGDHEEL